MSSQAEKSSCPLCEADNNCAIASGKPAEQCWCQGVEINPSVLDLIGADDKGVRCICPQCAGVASYENASVGVTGESE